LLVCRSNIRLFQLSCLPIFLSQCLLACLSFKYLFRSVILSAYLLFPVPACQSQSVSLPVSLLLTFTYICIHNSFPVCSSII
jgi:hypothetical protein